MLYENTRRNGKIALKHKMIPYIVCGMIMSTKYGIINFFEIKCNTIGDFFKGIT